MLTLVIVERLLGVGLGRQGKAGQAWEGRGWLGRGGGDHLGDGEVEGGEDEDEGAEQKREAVPGLEERSRDWQGWSGASQDPCRGKVLGKPRRRQGPGDSERAGR